MQVQYKETVEIQEEDGHYAFSAESVEKRLFRQESSVLDCEVEGTIPDDLEGAFHRVGPDPQYPLLPNNIPFDGDGHASVFRIKDGRVDYRSRYVQTDRYVAQDKARRLLFPMYRNPSMDDPSVKGLSRSTANTHIMHFQDKMLALKEDSPPSVLDPFTLETLDANHTFGGKLPSKTFTAHPKFDSHTGNLVAFGASAEGEGTDVISIFEFDIKTADVVWLAKIRAPYVSLVHDFAVTENYIAFFLQPLIEDKQQMARGGINWSWDGSQPSYLGCIRRDGDGSDIHWIKSASRGMYHIMGAFDDNQRLYIDADIAPGNQLPFMPEKNGQPWNPSTALGRVTRISMDMSKGQPSLFEMEAMYPMFGELPRQDDRYNTVPYRYGFRAHFPMGKFDGFTSYARFDHSTRKVETYQAEPNVLLSECVFAPKHEKAREGEGYILGVGMHTDQNNLADLLILDAEHIEDGPIATVKMPSALASQIHGSWTPEYKLATSNGHEK